MKGAVLLLLLTQTLAHLEIQLTRLPKNSKALDIGKNECQDPKTVDGECRYQ